ncbi:MAG TPA: YafY family protein [Rhodocyclaceae bacterium]|nr:YafY family protein [Rhodocyclaceae bacterium]
MTRTERLFTLMQILRRHRQPVSGTDLARETGVSLRTLYRDIATLQAQGAHIDGEAGVGYVLRPGFLLPPLMFSAEEIDAIVLGARWVTERADPALAAAARDALSKVAAVLPAPLRHQLDDVPLLIGPVTDSGRDAHTVAQLRTALRSERKLSIDYRDEHGAASQRVIWPCALGFFERVHVLVAWCERRADFRHFRVDRIERLDLLDAGLPRRRQALLREWRAREGITG